MNAYTYPFYPWQLLTGHLELVIISLYHVQPLSFPLYPWQLLAGAGGDPDAGAEPLHIPVGRVCIWHRAVRADDRPAALFPHQQQGPSTCPYPSREYCSFNIESLLTSFIIATT